MIAEMLYGSESEDYQVFYEAANIRIQRRNICRRFMELTETITKDEAQHRLAEEFLLSASMIKKITSKREVYLRHENTN